PESEFGRISKPIALSIKAKVLTLAASPLFNGNKDYTGWEDNRGKQLIPTEYDNKKWETAAIAIKEAIDTGHSAGNRMYKFNKFAGGADSLQMNEEQVQMMTIRKSITEDIDKNSSVIWATQEYADEGKGGSTGLGFATLGNMLRELFPRLHPEDQ